MQYTHAYALKHRLRISSFQEVWETTPNYHPTFEVKIAYCFKDLDKIKQILKEMPSDFRTFKTKLLKHFIKLHLLPPIKIFFNQMPLEKIILLYIFENNHFFRIFCCFPIFIHAFIPFLNNFTRHNISSYENKLERWIHGYVQWQ